VLKEKDLLGEGAFSRVSEVVEDTSNRTFALKRMTKTAALQCPEHVYCEQHISKNTTNAFCIRQYGSFKVRVFGAGRCFFCARGATQQGNSR
jgi:cGMP-dependent protein kinase 2